MANKSLGQAKNAKKDEFYTQLTDIENELRHYKAHFRDKTVLCNCDDPYESNFFKYFAMNFHALGLKRLIATCYEGSPIVNTQLSFFDEDETITEPAPRKAYYVDITEIHDETGNGAVGIEDVKILLEREKPKLLKGNGDFRSEECIEFLKQADIVVTNPPFSLFRDYVAQLIEYGKKFLIIGSQNAITYKEIFPLLAENKLWLGHGFPGNVGFFQSPYEDTAIASQHKEGLIRVSGVVWFTNLDHKKRHEPLDFYKHYNPEEYPHYDNYDAIEVSEVINIPMDYDGVMGVPITFMLKFCPEQFEILGTDSPYFIEKLGIGRIGEEWVERYKANGGTGHITANMHSLCYYDLDGTPKSSYKRILIKFKKEQST